MHGLPRNYTEQSQCIADSADQHCPLDLAAVAYMTVPSAPKKGGCVQASLVQCLCILGGAHLSILWQGRTWPYGHHEEPLDADDFLGGSLDLGHGSVPRGHGSLGPDSSASRQQRERASMMHRLHQDWQAYQVQVRPPAAHPEGCVQRAAGCASTSNCFQGLRPATSSASRGE